MKRLAAVGMACLVLLLVTVRVEPDELEYKLYFPIVATQAVSAQGAGATYGDCERIKKSGLTWFYDWSREPPICGESVPMIWGKNDVGKPIGGDSEWLLGFNEPELVAQANITPTLGVELWRQVEQAYPDKKLVSPAASISWLTSWWNQYQIAYGEPPRVDAVAGHCYGAWTVDCAVSKCKLHADSLIVWAEARDISEVWITEFAFLPCWPEGDAGTLQFMEEMVVYYQALPRVTRWAWFQNSYHGDEPWAFGPACNTSLVDIDTGELTAFGTMYSTLNYWE